MKQWASIFLAFLTMVLLVACDGTTAEGTLSSAAPETEEIPKTDNMSTYEPTEENGSQGLAYESNDTKDGYIVIGIGSCTDTEVVIPTVHNGLPVVGIRYSMIEHGIEYGAFYGTDVSAVILSDNITEIDIGAFAYCSNLISVTIPDSVTVIGDRAFSDCSGLTDITIPGSVTEIGQGAFASCSGLTKVTISYGVIRIGASAFFDCDHLTDIQISDSVTTLGTGVFDDCSSLESITIPHSVTNIEGNPFMRCDALTSIVVAEENPMYFSRGNCLISKYGFVIAGCKSSVIPDDGSVFGIADRAFAECNMLEQLTIPASVENIHSFAFYRCNKLTSISVSDGNVKYHSAGNCLIETTSKTLILGCESSVIPTDGSVTSISYRAFAGCRELTSIIIPVSVTRIGDGAFVDCDGLTKIYYTGTEETWQNIEIGSSNPAFFKSSIRVCNYTAE